MLLFREDGASMVVTYVTTKYILVIRYSTVESSMVMGPWSSTSATQPCTSGEHDGVLCHDMP